MHQSSTKSESEFHDSFYEAEADNIYQSYSYSLVTERNVNFLLRNIENHKSKSLLSLGCGNGSFELAISEYFKDIIGMDISPRAIEIANSRLGKTKINNISFLQADASNVNLNEQSVDVILILSTFHHLSAEDIDLLIKDSLKILKNGGYIISVDPNLYRIVGLLKFLVSKTFTMYHSPDERVIPPSLITGLLKKNEYINIEVKWLDFFYNPLCWVFPKMPVPIANTLSFLDKVLVKIPLLRKGGNAFGVVARKS
jgi:ubiquinone/menaquinone biosynthesis C-methylase UbiE